MTYEDSLSITRNLIFSVNGVLPEKVKESDSLVTDLLMDSVELIDFLLRLEEIGVIINESDITNVLTVEDIASYVLKQKKKGLSVNA